jgi:hypothetical protein
MVNEAILIYETAFPLNFTCNAVTGVEKGAIMKLTDPMTAVIASGENDAVAGICSGEKITSDGITKLGIYREGVFKVTLSGSCTVGDSLIIAYVNQVKSALNATSVSGSNIIGTALETATTGQTILMELNPRAVRYN